MPAVRALYERVRSVPKRKLPARVGGLVIRRIRLKIRRRRDLKHSTVLTDEQFEQVLKSADSGVATITRGWLGLEEGTTAHDAIDGTDIGGIAGLEEIARRARDHRFDMLGSGWVQVSYQTLCAGAFGHRYEMRPPPSAGEDQIARMLDELAAAAEFVSDTTRGLDRIREVLQGGRYRPIDWQLDFKSGYRWDSSTWYMDVPFGHLGGVDIKMPWELSRCHQLVTLAIDSAQRNDSDENAIEIALQLLDWITANPPRRGVNWRTSMEVGIRAANWIWALTILGRSDSIPPAVRWIVAKSLYQHGVHIEDNLEYSPDYTTNHYLANIVGLLHIAVSYPSFPESPRWTAFCLDELVKEMKKTVYPDGVNYEHSTGYHRLVTEMFVHGTLLGLRLSDEQRSNIVANRSGTDVDYADPLLFPDWYWTRLRRMFEYVADITKPNGLAVQFGDQDSGRFLKFSWIGSDPVDGEPVEESRDHRHLLAIGARLFGDDDMSRLGALYAIDGALATFASSQLPVVKEQSVIDGAIRYPSEDGTNGVRTVWYPFGGTCVMECGPYWVGIRCVPGSSGGPSGHRHNDQLSFELNINGQDYVVDPGTGTYTADIPLRNRMRSTAAHSTLAIVGQEQNVLVTDRPGVFVLRDRTNAKCTRLNNGTFFGEHTGFEVAYKREFILDDRGVTITDEIASGWEYNIAFILDPDVRVRPKYSGSDLRLETAVIGSIPVVVSRTTGTCSIDQTEFAYGYGIIAISTVLNYSGIMDQHRVTTRIGLG